MTTFRVKFRGGGDDQLIEADGMSDSGDSYIFYDDHQNVVGQVPKDVVKVVLDEKAEG